MTSSPPRCGHGNTITNVPNMPSAFSVSRCAFFKAHRDTEKADGMFGTLVIVLPCPHRGGELVIRHAGREATVDLSAAEDSELAFAAFYADCEHEVRPIVKGNRVCLIYNLAQRRQRKTGDSSLT